MSAHPSLRELDRIALGDRLPEASAHVQGCAVCGEHMERLLLGVETPSAALRDAAGAEARPGHPSGRRASGRRVFGRRGRARVPGAWIPGAAGTRGLPGWLGWAGVPALAAAAATVWMVVAPAPTPDGAATGAETSPRGTGASPEGQEWLAAKGAPSFAIFVKRGEKLALWDGESPLIPGDRLRIRVAPHEFTHVALGSLDESGSWSVLYRGELGANPDVLLPGSWEVDGTPGKEHLVIALDRRPVDIEAAPWRREVELPKAALP